MGAVIGSETSSGMNQAIMTGIEVVSNGGATGSERASRGDSGRCWTQITGDASLKQRRDFGYIDRVWFGAMRLCTNYLPFNVTQNGLWLDPDHPKKIKNKNEPKNQNQ